MSTTAREVRPPGLFRFKTPLSVPFIRPGYQKGTAVRIETPRGLRPVVLHAAEPADRGVGSPMTERVRGQAAIQAIHETKVTASPRSSPGGR